MANPPMSELSRRERQIMDILIENRRCSAQEVMDKLPQAPSYSAVRALLARLAEKGAIQFTSEAGRYIYSPVIREDKAQQGAIQRLIQTFFRGSRSSAFSALLDLEGDALNEREIAELERKIKALKTARKSGNKND